MQRTLTCLLSCVNFTRVITVRLARNEIEHIPDWAFRSLTHLQSIYLSDNHIRTIGSYPFFPVPSLHYVTLRENSLTHIPAETLRFTNTSTILQIDMKRNLLDDQSFPVLNNTNRPVRLDLSWNRMNSLPRHAFESFFQTHNASHVRLNENPVTCGCQVKWLLQNPDLYLQRVEDIKCHGKVSLFNLTIQSLGRC